MTFSAKELGHRGIYESVRGRISFTAPSGHPCLEARHADPIDVSTTTLHVGDHWCYGQMRIDQARGWDQHMTEDEKRLCRGLLGVQLEARILGKTMDQAERQAHRRRPAPPNETPAPRRRL